MTRDLLIEEQGAVLVATLNRPARRNALTLAMLNGLRAAIADAAADANIGAIVLTGAPPAFCSGMDLGLLAADCSVERCEFLIQLGALLDDIAGSPKPVVAAVNGPAVAGGAAVVTACDITIAAEGATFGYPAIHEGVAAAVVTPHLIRAVGERRARYLLLTGRLIAAAEARSMGIFHEVVPAATGRERSIETANSLAQTPKSALVAVKRYLAAALTADHDPSAIHLPE
jgi:methylglutaconyl-CoA hydratase